MSTSEDRRAVVVGVANVSRKPTTPDEARAPAVLLAAAVREAAEDAGLTPGQLAEADRLDVVNLLSWCYTDPAGVVAQLAGLRPRQAVYSAVGGDQPTRLLAAAASRLQRGETRLEVVAGGESLRSRRVLRAAGIEPDWTPQGTSPVPVERDTGTRGTASTHGFRSPVRVYPAFDVARRAALDPTPAEGHCRAARIQEGLARVATRVPGAAVATAPSAEEIATPSRRNRWVAWPYTKTMCANNDVDQAAAAVLTTVGHARRLGIPTDRMIHLWSATGAKDTTDVLARPSYAESVPIRTVLQDAAALAGGVPDLLELYSCFPVVPWMAADALAVGLDRELTVTGGLTFYGGPINAYMLCATTAMVQALRGSDGGTTGLLYGNGEYATKHHTVLLGTDPAPQGGFQEDDEPARQARVEREQGALPRVVDVAEGAATVETCTVLPNQSGGLASAIVVGRLADGARFVARTDDCADTLEVLTSSERHPVGLPGVVRHHSSTGRNHFTLEGDTP